MKIKNATSLKGFRDFLPKDVQRRTWLKNQMVRVFEKWGYEPIETPVLEPLEIFEGQVGEDEKMFFKFKDPGGRNVALRYDQTVPTCRFLGQHYDKLTFPFRRYQIQTAYRAEKPQKGRYREFVQADVDIFGDTSPLADAECIALSLDLYKTLGFKKPIALINNRDLLKDIPYPVIASVDKLRKIGLDQVIQEIKQKGFTLKEAKDFITKINNLKPDYTLKEIFNYLDKYGFDKSNYKYEPTLVRSFSYSQGPIWEIVLEGFNRASFAGSVGGGERYDDMLEKISGRQIGGTGIAFGFDRTLEACEEMNLIPVFPSITKVLVTVFSPETWDQSLEISSYLRKNGVNAELYPNSSTKLDKQIKYADKKNIPFVLIAGPNEIKSNKVVLKNILTREQTSDSLTQITKNLKD